MGSLIPDDLNVVVRDLYARPITRSPRAYGASSIGFCMEKIVLSKRLESPVAMSAAMLTGKVYHEVFFRKIVQRVFPVGWKVWQRPRYENEVRFVDPRGFTIEAHPDIDLPAYDRIIECKTTSHRREWSRGEFLTEAYISQANAYAWLKGRKFWEIWVVALDFDDALEEDFMTRITGETSEEEWKDFIERVWFIDQAIQQGQDLVGPEQQWECKRCQFLFECPHHVEKLRKLIGLLPATRASLDAEMQRELDLLADVGCAVYDKKEKVWKVINGVETGKE